MSNQLAIAVVLSVLMMAGYVLLGNDAVHVPLGPNGLVNPAHISAPTATTLDVPLPFFR